QVADLSPLAGLKALQTLDCSYTQVADLTPLAGLDALQNLSCSGTMVADLTPLAGLGALQDLDCSGTMVADLTPLAGLGALQDLDCSYTQVADLTPLAGLKPLQNLDCSHTEVADLTPLAGLTALQSLICYGTQVADLTPLAGLRALHRLISQETPVRDLVPIAHLALNYANFSNCALSSLPDAWLDRDDLHLALHDSIVDGLPAELLSSEPNENCLPAIRAHFADLAKGTAPLPGAKVIVLGNGGVGKTQLCRRLRGEPFQEDWDSTHGIRVSTAELAGPKDEPLPLPLTLWDFGGQEIYHGTHALFMRTDAVFLVLWATEHETGGLTDAGGLTFRNHPLQYWADYVHHTAGARSPTILVQTRCDTYADEVRRAPVSEETLDALGLAREVRASARTGHGWAELTTALHAGIAWLREKRGALSIGLGRLAVQHKIEALRSPDGSLPATCKLMDKAEFHQLCEDAGGVSDADLLLRYFHNSGLLFHRPGLFQDKIVLDHAWALNGIYILFDRRRCYSVLKDLRGRFTRPRLEDLAWGEAGFTMEEQRLFLSMMETAGMCFVHERDGHSGHTVYIAPELLPGREAVQVDLDERWGTDPADVVLEWHYPLLHPGIVRSVISRIGARAGVNALYWRTGVFAFEIKTRAGTLVEEVRANVDAHAGCLRLSVRGGRAGDLAPTLRKMVEAVNADLGLRPELVEVKRARASIEARAEVQATPKAPAPPGDAPTFGSEPAVWVSYAWKDATREVEADHKAEVNRLCEEAEKRGITVSRDTTHLGVGDRISDFMKRLGAGQRVFVLLSDAYLKSPSCMTELYEIWRNSRLDEADFRERVRVYVFPDAEGISDLDGCAGYHDYWNAEIERQSQVIEKVGGLHKIGETHRARYNKLCDIRDSLIQILGALSDIRHPTTVETFVDHGLGDLPKA
ncbi:MAG: TIR domain-containing protein, partial [Caenispirillum sp.]|nr:TIR domain-containing protein [Caenispirillum sp.]